MKKIVWYVVILISFVLLFLWGFTLVFLGVLTIPYILDMLKEAGYSGGLVPGASVFFVLATIVAGATLLMRKAFSLFGRWEAKDGSKGK